MNADKVWLDRMSENEDLVIEVTGSPSVSNLHLNTTMPPLDNILVRKAIAHAIDFESFRTSMKDGWFFLIALVLMMYLLVTLN